MSVKFRESLVRSVTKTISFRIVIICADIIVVYAITHRYDTTFGVVVATNIASTLLYLVHERLWNAIHWGKHKVTK